MQITIFKESEGLQSNLRIEARPVNLLCCRQRKGQTNTTLSNQRIDVNIIFGLSAHLNNRRFGAGEIEERGNT